jgi:putative FmdB family regulatory protein
MPIYEFVCRDCDTQFEELTTQAEVEAGEVACPGCGGRRVAKQLSTFASTVEKGAPCGRPSGAGCGSGGFG